MSESKCRRGVGEVYQTAFYGLPSDVPLAGKWIARCANGALPLPSVGCTILQALPTNTRRPTRTPEPTGTPTPFPLTPYPNCHIVIVAEGGANVRRGPSLDDMRANRIGNQPNQRVTGGPFPVIAYAPDELNADIVWYGFEYSERPGFISWVADKNPENTSVNISQLQGSSCASFLVDLTRKFVISPYSIGGNVLTNPSIALFSTGLHRGFGIRNANDYSSIPFCRHPGFDFPVSANTVVQSIADGVVVGMGDPREPSRKPFQWGANAGKTAEEIVINGEYKAHNLVVRTGGHYILYGHLNSIDTSLYLGKLVRIGDRLGDVADEGLNSHLHLEIRAFLPSEISDSVRPAYGALRYAGSPPSLVVDFMYFVSPMQRGSASTSGSQVVCSPNNTAYDYTVYSGSAFGEYNAANEVTLLCFSVINGGINSNPATCVSPQ